MDDESIAALADGTSATGAQSRHLSRCRACAGSYAEAIRFRVRDLAAARSAEQPSSAFSSSSNAHSRLGPRSLQVFGVLVLVFLALLAPRWWKAPEQAVPPAEVRSLLEVGSARSLVLLGGEGVDPETLVTYRSADPTEDPDVDQSLRSWSRALRAGKATHSEAVWLVGGLSAQGFFHDAAVALEFAQGQWPRDRDLAVLDAVLAWRARRDAEAEALLLQVLTEDPGHSVARYNLGWMLRELGREDEARDHLGRVAREQNGHPLGKRAAALIGSLEGN